MIKVSIRTDKKQSFTIPVPYALLQVSSSILSSEWLWKRIVKLSNKHTEKPISLENLVSETNRHLLKHLIKEIKQYRGLELVNVSLKDGTKVKVKL
jgi:hypothetical protein